MADTENSQQQNELQQAFEEFKQTRFYQLCDSFLVGRFHWLILPVTGFIDAFVVILPTEAVLGVYLVRDKARSWVRHTAWVTLFATVGYVLLAMVSSMFGEPFAVWFSSLIGEELSTTIDGVLTTYVLILAITAGVTSVFPMPATAFAIVVGLIGAPLIPFAIGVFIGKFIRFGAIGYAVQRYGAQAFDYYMGHANWLSLIIVLVVAVYVGVRYIF